jgi:hypothetical protein
MEAWVGIKLCFHAIDMHALVEVDANADAPSIAPCTPVRERK